jgi:hypothetical protein
VTRSCRVASAGSLRLAGGPSGYISKNVRGSWRALRVAEEACRKPVTHMDARHSGLIAGALGVGYDGLEPVKFIDRAGPVATTRGGR